MLRHFLESPIPDGELVQNLFMFLAPQHMRRLFFWYELYQEIVNVPGCIMQFGVRRGRDLAAWEATFEQECELGDIAIYDSRTIHGVEDVDPKKVYDPTSPAGRIAGFVTLYRDIRNAKELYPGYLLSEHNEDLNQGIEFDRASGER